MDTLTAEQRAWQMKARQFAQEEIRPISLARDRILAPHATWDWDIIRKGSRLGFRTAVVPREWGGHAIDFVTQALVMAELARGDSAVSKAFSQNWKWGHLIAGACSQEQKERFLKPFIADDTYVLGYGGTEPNAGSDNRYPQADDPRAGMRLKAERRGDEWLLNGEKCFIANGGVGKLFFVGARTNPDVPVGEGTTVFMVPAGTPGFRIGKIYNKSGWRFYQNAELIFENARVPHANILGEVNGAAKARARGGVAEFNDFELACNALGVCDDACESALTLAKSRQQGGRPLLEQQVIALAIAEMHMLTEALRSFVMRIAAEIDRAAHTPANVVLLMNYSTDVIQKVTALNMEIHGTRGAMDAHADKLMRDAIIWTHLAGDATQRLKVVRRLAG